MQQKIPVVICSGTTCYVLGGAQLLSLDELIDPDLRDKIEIEGSTCLGFCKNQQYGKAPFAKVGTHVLTEATPAKIAAFVRQLLEAEE